MRQVIMQVNKCQSFTLVEKNSYNKVANKIAFRPSFNTSYDPYMCVDGVTKRVEHQ